MDNHWLECLIAAARETDPRFDAEHQVHWRNCLVPCVDLLTRRHAV